MSKPFKPRKPESMKQALYRSKQRITANKRVMKLKPKTK